MTGKAEHRTAAAVLGPEIIDGPEAQAFDREAQRREPLDHHLLATAVDGTDRLARNQLLGQSQGAGHQKRRTGGWRPRWTTNPNPPKAAALINTHAGMANPRNCQVTLAHSPEPVRTFTSTSLKEKTLSMKSSDAPQAGTASGGKLWM